MTLDDLTVNFDHVDAAALLSDWRWLIGEHKTPILITLAIFTFLGTWNDFFWPLVVLTDDSKYTLPVALANLFGEHVQDTEMMMAGSVLTVMPVLLLFLFLQRHYVQGLLMGSVKE